MSSFKFYKDTTSNSMIINTRMTIPSGPTNPPISYNGSLFYNSTNELLYISINFIWVPVGGGSSCISLIQDDCLGGDTIVNTNPNLDYVSVDSNNGLLVKAFNQANAQPMINGAPGSTGAGIRMSFMPFERGAFRSGEVTGTQWDTIGDSSAAFGLNTQATESGSFASGSATDSGEILSSGPGASASGYADNPNSLIHAANAGSHAQGSVTTSGQIITSGFGSFISGYAGGSGSIKTTSGAGNNAFGFASNFGQLDSRGSGSLTVGYVNGSNEITQILTNGIGAAVIGRDVRTNYAYSLTIGKYGTAIEPSIPFLHGEGSFQIAGGSSTTNRDISVVIGTDLFGMPSSGGGVANFWNTAGADYAEFFEWDDGNLLCEDRIGYFVKLNNDKIIMANDNTDVLGVVGSVKGSAGYLADIAELRWHDAYKTDKYGRKIVHMSYIGKVKDILSNHKVILTNEINIILAGPDDQTLITNILAASITSEDENFVQQSFTNDMNNIIPLPTSVANELYDPSIEYIPRCARKEWTPVGLLGKVYVRDNGNCIVGSKCDCVNGIAVPGTKWQVLSRKDIDVIRIFYR